MMTMKGLLALICLSTGAFAAGTSTDVGGGGEFVTQNGEAILRDLVDSYSCEWLPGESFTERLSRWPGIVSALGEKHWYLGTALERESRRLNVCPVRAPLKKIRTEDADGVTIAMQGAKQAAIRIGNRVFIDAQLFAQASADTQVLLWLHEVSHSLVPMDTEGRNQKLRSLIALFDRVLRNPITTADLQYQMRMNGAAIPSPWELESVYGPALRDFFDDECASREAAASVLEHLFDTRGGLMVNSSAGRDLREILLPNDAMDLDSSLVRICRENDQSVADAIFALAERDAAGLAEAAMGLRWIDVGVSNWQDLSYDAVPRPNRWSLNPMECTRTQGSSAAQTLYSIAARSGVPKLFSRATRLPTTPSFRETALRMAGYSALVFGKDPMFEGLSSLPENRQPLIALVDADIIASAVRVGNLSGVRALHGLAPASQRWQFGLSASSFILAAHAAGDPDLMLFGVRIEGFDPRRTWLSQGEGRYKESVLTYALRTCHSGLAVELLRQDWSDGDIFPGYAGERYELVNYAFRCGREFLLAVLRNTTIPATYVQPEGGRIMSPLGYAIETGDREVIEILLSRNDTKAGEGSYGLEPSSHCPKHALSRKVTAYCDPLATFTPLMLATRKGDIETVRDLLARKDASDWRNARLRGADVDAAWIAEFEGHFEIEKLLK